MKCACNKCYKEPQVIWTFYYYCETCSESDKESRWKIVPVPRRLLLFHNSATIADARAAYVGQRYNAACCPDQFNCTLLLMAIVPEPEGYEPDM